MSLEELLEGSILSGKKVTLCVTGGIACYKSIELLRLIQKAGAKVKVVMSKMATRFIGEETFSSLTGEKVTIDFEGMEHINIPHSSDLIVVAPATANIIGKFANGICDTMISTILISATCPIVFVPSMNWAMLKNPFTEENIQKIKKAGHIIVPPDEGDLACGEKGEGKFPTLDKIFFHCEYAISQKSLKNKKVIITAGPTKEYIDDIRFISNPSSGFMGYVISWETAIEGAETHLITGGETFNGEKIFHTQKVETAEDMLNEVEKLLPTDIFIGSAAVSDFRPVNKIKGKIKKDKTERITIELERTKDILENVRKYSKIVVGFSLESENIEQNTIEKMVRKNLDIIVGNSPDSFSKPYGKYFICYKKNGGTEIEYLGDIHKRLVARKIINRIIDKI